MNFFRAREAAAEWCADRPGIAILSIEEGCELARVHWLDRLT